MTGELAEIYFDADGEAFEEKGLSNGARYWLASTLARMLGYSSLASSRNAINRAIGTCTSLGIPVSDNFTQVQINGKPDYKLSRFACYLVAMNGDTKKPAVAAAQAYFATLAEAARRYMEAADEFERVQIRDEISDREKSLSGVAKQAGVTAYHFFQSAGYRGLYNMDMAKLKQIKGLQDERRSLLDFMGKRELAANLFRITETEAKLKIDKISGQARAEAAAEQVGRRVRNAMIATDGTKPESLPLAADIKAVRKDIKATAKELKKIDDGRG